MRPKQIFVTDKERNLVILNRKTLKLNCKFKIHDSYIENIANYENSLKNIDLLLTCSNDGKTNLIDLNKIKKKQ
jgi:hypothetical protein